MRQEIEDKIKEQNKRNRNLLDYVPYLEEDVIFKDGVLYSQLSRGMLSKVYLKILRKKDIKKTYLDDIGQWIIKRIDSEATVREIGKELKKEFGQRVDPVYKTLTIFLRSLIARRIIKLTYKNNKG